MFPRHINISKKRSFFLFGARATGKSTLLEQLFSPEEYFLVNLLEPRLYAQLQAYPEQFEPLIRSALHDGKTIVVDEIQRVPQLLDVVHLLIQREKALFALTGSSARKLKRGAANLLAGRASVYNLFPLLFTEIGESFSLIDALAWGTLPEVVSLESERERSLLLQAYSDTYVREEIVAEQIIRKLPPFRRFLEVAAQSNGKLINYSSIAADIATDPSNVRNYFEVLEDTLLGFRLQPFSRSVRKRQRQSPKFFWFDTGVARSLQKSLGVPVRPSTSDFGSLFEAFVINQIRAGLEYQLDQYDISFLMTKEGAEIDLVVERAGKPTLCLEIKSGENVRGEQLRNVQQLSRDIENAEAICLYRGSERRMFDEVTVIPWNEGLIELGLVPTEK